MPEVKGRIDHIDVNVKDKVVYIAALDNNTVEVVDIQNGKVIHSIKGLDEPQGVGYIPQTNEILWLMAVMGIVIFIVRLHLRKGLPFIYLLMQMM